MIVRESMPWLPRPVVVCNVASDADALAFASQPREDLKAIIESIHKNSDNVRIAEIVVAT